MARLHRQVVATLLGRIAGGEYAPGSLLPKEQAIADEFRIARGTAREAIRALEERRVVAVKHGRGARVADPAEWDVIDPVIAEALLEGRERRRFVGELVTCLQMTEPELVALAAERATARDLDAIAASKSPAELTHALHRAAANRPLGAMITEANALLAKAGARDDPKLDRAVADAVLAGDPEKARAAALARIEAVAPRR